MSVTTPNGMDVNFESASKASLDSIKRIIENEKYKTYDIAVKNFNSNGNNFLGELYEIEITGETEDGKKDTNIFIKQKVSITNLKLVSVENVYLNEVFVYKDLSKIFTRLQDEFNVPQQDRYKIAKAYEETDTNAIILENVIKKGFKSFEKLERVPIKYAELAIKEIAKFHALNFVVEQKMPEYFNQKMKVLKSPLVLDDDWAGLMRNICAYVASLYDNDMNRRIQKMSLNLIEKLPKYFNNQSNVRCTLTHGDYKKNNLMAREQNGEVAEIIPIDYQLIFYGCPIMDFLFFIFGSTDREFRKKHLNELKELYFETLSWFLKHFDVDVEDVYPRNEFEKVYTEWLDFGLMMSLFGSFFMLSPDTKMELSDIAFSDLPFCPDEKYNYLLRGLIDDFVEWGYI